MDQAEPCPYKGFNRHSGLRGGCHMLDLNENAPQAGAGNEGLKTGQIKNDSSLSYDHDKVKPALFLVALVLRIIESIIIPGKFHPRISLMLDRLQIFKEANK